MHSSTPCPSVWTIPLPTWCVGWCSVSECLLDGREAVICQLASPLIDHGDATVREAAVTLLGSLPELQPLPDFESREPKLCCS